MFGEFPVLYLPFGRQLIAIVFVLLPTVYIAGSSVPVGGQTVYRGK
jgi:hypothetical protein